MKIALLSTYKKGGAGIACERLKNALMQQGEDLTMLVQQKIIESNSLKSITHSPLDDFKAKLRLSKEVFQFVIHEKSKADRFQFSTATSGTDLSRHPVIRSADIIHLHWINQGFLSTESIKKLYQTGKPVVWTLHDMWAFTGGCHYSGICRAYEKECNFCPFLKDPSYRDLSNKGWKRKEKFYRQCDKITFVTCSDWLKNVAQSSSLLKNFRIESIPNPINTEQFYPVDSYVARKHWKLPHDKKLLLFGAMSIKDKRKGFDYLIATLEHLAQNYPALREQMELVLFGKTDLDLPTLPFKTHSLGSINSIEDMIMAYSSSDVFILPSLEDNLPNTVMESLACGTPVVAFNNGGTPQMIEHLSNGYLANYKDNKDMAEGIQWTLSSPVGLRTNSRKKVLENFSQELISEKYISLYKELLQS